MYGNADVTLLLTSMTYSETVVYQLITLWFALRLEDKNKKQYRVNLHDKIVVVYKMG